MVRLAQHSLGEGKFLLKRIPLLITGGPRPRASSAALASEPEFSGMSLRREGQWS